MVANQSMGSSGKEYKGQLTAALTKVKMDEDKKYILNIPEWKESLKSAFVTFGLSEFLRAEYAIQVPANVKTHADNICAAERPLSYP